MQNDQMGQLIKRLRLEHNYTQKQLGQLLGVSDKAVSKWERGQGAPDLSIIQDLVKVLNINSDILLAGEINYNKQVGGNMKNSKYYVCPVCHNISVCTGNAQVICCDKKLEALKAKKAQDCEKLKCEQIETEWYISSDHSMTKDHYISFVAFATGSKVELIKQFPEWDLSLRIFKRERGTLYWYCTKHGLYYQYL